MGQYYKIVNTSLYSFIDPCDFNNHSKLTSHSWIGNSLVNSVCNLLAEGNPWYKTRLVWSGDYANSNFTSEYSLIIDCYHKRESLLQESYDKYDINLFTLTDIAKFTRLEKFDLLYNSLLYGFNETKKEYYSLNDCPISSKSAIHPLPLLLAHGNGEGNGDYFGDSGIDLIGSWANDVIFTSSELPNNINEYKKIKPRFKI